MKNIFVLEYQQTDNCTYWADKILFVEGEDEDSETSISLKILDFVETKIKNLKEQGLNNKSISQYIENTDISISGVEVPISTFVNYSTIEQKFIYTCDLIPAEDYIHNNSIKLTIN